MIKGSCHCGKVSFTIKNKPEKLTDCNCSICRRIGALWAHAGISEIEVNCPPDSTTGYIQGDKLLAIHSCNTCGCTTHWENLNPQEEGAHMAVNFRMVDPEIIAQIPIKRFDGADTWEYLD